MILTSLAAAIQLREESQLANITATDHRENAKYLRDMKQASSKRTVALFEMLHTSDPFLIDELFIFLNEQGSNFVKARNKLKKNITNNELMKLLEVQGWSAQYTAPKQLKVYDLLVEDKYKDAMDLFINETLPKSKIFNNLLESMAETESLRSQKVSEDAKKHSNSTLVNILLFDAISIIISIFLTIFITKKQKASNQHLTLLASTDKLTSLPNRASLVNSINSILINKPSEYFALAFIDIDSFKSINDNYGHEYGDIVIKSFAEKIQSNIKSPDILSRFGGDEFILLLQSVNSEVEARNCIRDLSSSLDTSFIIDKDEIFVSASIGVALYPQDALGTNSLLRNADIAMYSAKQQGKNNYQFFSTDFSLKLEKEHKLRHSLSNVLNKGNQDKELYLMYQPLRSITDENSEIVECEALIRWNNNKNEQISPDVFIPIAEKSNLIEKINIFVIDEACKQQYEWHKNGVSNFRININLSGNRRIFVKLLERLRSNLEKYSLQPSHFGIELTERTLFEISDETIEQLDVIRKQGMKIAIDDFGTGYSSLSYLKKLPITTLKIDQGFIAGLPDDKDDQALVKAIITLGHSLQLEIVAEGVETYEQYLFLQEHSCNTAQGYYFHRPLSCAHLSQLKLAA